MKTFCFFLLFATRMFATTPSWVTLHGYLDREQIEAATETVKDAKEQLILSISSSSGDLREVLRFAGILYEKKQTDGLNVTVYINRQAVGPSALLPFVADELYTSLFVAWGDIVLGSSGQVPKNQLRTAVLSLIDPSRKEAPILRLLAEGMINEQLIVYEDDGWKIAQAAPSENRRILSPKGETLVINHAQIKELDVAHRAIPLNAFEERYGFEPRLLEKEVEAVRRVRGQAEIDQELKDTIKPDLEGKKNKIGYIAIKDKDKQISTSTWLYIKTALDHFKKTKPLFIILELNTPGGEVFAAQKISDALKDMDTQEGIPVVTFINNWAISAGAMIAYSTRFIATQKDASMGAAEPVIMGKEGQMETASEKVRSALRTDFASRASFFGRDPQIAEAMVDSDLILVFRNNRVVKLDREDQILPEDTLITAKGKLLTLGALDLQKYGVSDFYLEPMRLVPKTDQEAAEGKWPLDKMLLSQVPFFKEIPNGTVEAYSMDWRTRFFVFLTEPFIASLLLMGVMVGFYIEFNTPGFGVFGSIGVVCLTLILMANFALELSSMLEVVLLILGASLILVEVFLLPSFGLIGFFGVLFFLSGLFALMLPEVKDFTFDTDPLVFRGMLDSILHRLAWFSFSLILSICIMALLARYVLPHQTAFNHLILVGGEQETSKGYSSGIDPNLLPKEGAKGSALTPLRPSGKIMIEEKIFEAITSGGFIEKGQQVEVVKRLSGSLLVERLEGHKDQERDEEQKT